MRVVVAGQGYVGLPLAVRAADVGHCVVGYDVDAERVKRLMAGESYVEDVAGAALEAVLASGAYRPTAQPRDCAGFDIAVITVPTPLRDGVPDLAYLEGAAPGTFPASHQIRENPGRFFPLSGASERVAEQRQMPRITSIGLRAQGGDGRGPHLLLGIALSSDR